ncbi:ATP-grasp domain-containing protein [Azospirillum sp. ST 5-10]|uniref:ATP-grasp domain-containing protein n=1 Tax=unclassified Azospirillum TaxID=2630922 RepID=UPI003F49E5B7
MTRRILVCEYVTGGGLGGRVAEGPFAALRHEGERMACALANDLMGVAGVQATVARDRALPPPDAPARVHWVDGADPWPAWAAAIAAHDAVWPIAPESDGLLERLSRLVLAERRTLLGSAPDAVAHTAGKRATAERLAAAGVPAVPAHPPWAEPPSAHGWIVKPDDGAGAEGVRHLRDAAALAAWRAADPHPGYVVQPFVPGVPASLSLLCRDGRAWLLAVNRQLIDEEADGALGYRGSVVGALNHRAAEVAPLAQAVAAAFPGLWGHVGVDLILADGGPVVVEVNPRLTTSYVGLHEALARNPAALALADAPPDLPLPAAGRAVEVRV